MGFTPEQIKGRIKSVAKQNNADARTLMRIYMMERFLERLAQSEYRDNFIIKGGILVTAMIGVAHRSTMDIDTSMKNLNLSAEDALRVVNQVKDIDLDDGVSFEVKDVSNIMDEMEYPGIRVTMNANVGRLITPLKIDISTGDVITPRAIEFNYDLLLEDRSISLWSYNLETILAEKLQTVLARGIHKGTVDRPPGKQQKSGVEFCAAGAGQCKRGRSSGRPAESAGRYSGRDLHLRDVLSVRIDRCAGRCKV